VPFILADLGKVVVAAIVSSGRAHHQRD
jgi:hypothetical protein